MWSSESEGPTALVTVGSVSDTLMLGADERLSGVLRNTNTDRLHEKFPTQIARFLGYFLPRLLKKFLEKVEGRLHVRTLVWPDDSRIAGRGGRQLPTFTGPYPVQAQTVCRTSSPGLARAASQILSTEPVGSMLFASPLVKFKLQNAIFPFLVRHTEGRLHGACIVVSEPLSSPRANHCTGAGAQARVGLSGKLCGFTKGHNVAAL